MKRARWFFVGSMVACFCIGADVAAQVSPQPTDLPGKPFVLKTNWLVGGDGGWDFIRFDPSYLQLFIAHGANVQVVDVESGAVIANMRSNALILESAFPGSERGGRAADIALDDHGEFGYISDIAAGEVTSFDRRTHRLEHTFRTGANPRAMVFEPSSRLLFVVCGPPLEAAPSADRAKKSSPEIPRRTPSRYRPSQPSESDPSPGTYALLDSDTFNGSNSPEPPLSVITVIDTEAKDVLGNLVIRGRAGFAAGDDDGRV